MKQRSMHFLQEEEGKKTSDEELVTKKVSQRKKSVDRRIYHTARHSGCLRVAITILKPDIPECSGIFSSPYI